MFSDPNGMTGADHSAVDPCFSSTGHVLFRSGVSRDRWRLDPFRRHRRPYRVAPGQDCGVPDLFRRSLHHLRSGLGQPCTDRTLFRHGMTLRRPGLTLLRRCPGFAGRNPADYALDAGNLSIDSGLVAIAVDEVRASLPWSCPIYTEAAASLPRSASDFTTTAREEGDAAREMAR